MRFVPIKTAEQQSVLMLHRTRDLLVRQRTQLINGMRAHLAELGLVAARGREGVQSFGSAGKGGCSVKIGRGEWAGAP
jgi:transposase